MKKRCFSLFLSLALAFSLIPWSSVIPVAAAEEPTAAETLTDMKQALTMVSAEEAETEQTHGYSLLDLTVSGYVATVSYAAPEDATILVSIYTEDGKQLKASGNAPASAEGTTVQVELTGSMPSYFQAAAFLVRTHDLAPLCDAFRTSRYTKDMQNLLKSTVNSYTKDRVINLDEDKNTNFMVMQKGVVHIPASESVNVFTTADRENNRYVIENADKTVTGLQKGGTLVHQLTDGSWVVAKVDSIQVEGTTVTIQASTPELSEVFSHVKIEHTGTTEQLTVDESTLGEGVTFVGAVEPAPQARTMTMRSASAQDDFFKLDTGTQLPLLAWKLEVELEVENPESHVTTTVKDELDIFVGVEFSNDYYMANGSVVSGKRLDAGLMINNELEGKIVSKALELGQWTWDPIPGVVSVGFEPFIGLELTGKVETEFKAVYTAGVYYDQLAGGYCSSAPVPKVECKTKLEGDMFIGLDFNPTAEILGGYLLDADVTAVVGFYFLGEGTGTRHGSLAELPEEEDAEIPTELHSCPECIDGEIFFGVKLGLEIKVADLDLLRSVDAEIFLTEKICDFYYRTDPALPILCGLGTCPYRLFRITVEALDNNGDPIADAEVTATRSVMDVLGLPLANPMGKTNENGIVSNYISGGSYTFDAGEARDTENYVHINAPGKVRLDGSHLFYASSEPGSSLAPLLEKIIDSGEVVASGESGTIEWSMTAGGFLTISGTGDITEKPWTESGVKPRVVVIGEGITGIGNNIFGYTDVFSVTLPSTLQVIGELAFRGTELKTVVIPDNVTAIYNGAFADCYSLSSVTFPFEMEYLAMGAFDGCAVLDNVILPRGLTKIEGHTFENCSGLTNLSLPNTVTSIGEYAFAGCESLEKIKLHSTVTQICNHAFYKCGLTELELPEAALDLGNSAFWWCRDLKSVRLPSRLKVLPDAIFDGCKSLESIALPDTLETISVVAFRGCESLPAIEIPERVTNIGIRAFANCKNLTSVKLPTTLEHLANEIFKDCESLTTITIPSTVTSIGFSAFSGCKSLPAINIPSSVISMDDGVFENCESLQQITLPAGITTISDHLFSGCHSLEKVTMRGVITSIGKQGFSGCAFTEFTVPETVTSLGFGAFAECKKMQRIQLPETGLTAIPDACFYECDGLITFKIPEAVTSLGAQAFEYCDQLTHIELSDGITCIRSDTFRGCDQLSEVVLPAALEEIDDWAFAYCPALRSIELPATLTRIGVYAFGSSGLTTIEIPEGVTCIENDTFIWCESLRTVKLPGTLKTIEMNAFKFSALTSVDIPNSVTHIGYTAFFNTDLKSVTIPGSVESIDSAAFQSCPDLSSIYFEGDVPDGHSWFSSLMPDEDGVRRTVDVYYPAGNATWTDEAMERVQGSIRDENIAFISYTPSVAAVTVSAAPKMPAQTKVESAIGGQYGEETIDGTKYKTASFTGLVPGRSYLLLAVADINVSLLDPNNVLYMNQLVADAEGKTSHSYIQRVTKEVSFVMLCGGDQQDLSSAAVTFPTMLATDRETPVAPVVELAGKVLTEGVDYRLEGDVTYTKAGTYSLTIRGIYGYTGTITCTYTVSDGIIGDVDGNKVLNTDDAVYLLLHVMFGTEDYPVADNISLDFDGSGKVNTDDAVYLLLHVMFGAEDYPLAA